MSSFPIRCFSCGKPIAHLYEKYIELTSSGKSSKEALDELGVERYCCRSAFLTHVELSDTIGRFRKS